MYNLIISKIKDYGDKIFFKYIQVYNIIYILDFKRKDESTIVSSAWIYNDVIFFSVSVITL